MKNAVAFLTGAASGIGAATAKTLAGRGAKVAVCDLNEADGQRLADEIGGSFIHCDVSRPESIGEAVAVCSRQLGTPRYALLNAGVMTVPAGDDFLALEDVSAEQYRRILGVNLDGVFFGLKALVPGMRKEGGAITVTASTAAFGILPIDPLYVATKHALVGLLRSLAAANKGGKLRFNAICPGVVDTPLVPAAFRNPETVMSPELLASDIVALLESGKNGEVRARLSREKVLPVPPLDLNQIQP